LYNTGPVDPSNLKYIRVSKEEKLFGFTDEELDYLYLMNSDSQNEISRWVIQHSIHTAIDYRPLVDEFIQITDELRKKSSESSRSEKIQRLEEIIDELPLIFLYQLEKEIVTWFRYGVHYYIYDIYEMILEKTRKTDLEESKMGRFSLSEGSDVKQGLSDLVDPGTGGCLNCITDLLLQELYEGEERKVDLAKERYRGGVSERKRGPHSEATLSRIASELRKEELTSPATILRFKKDGFEPTLSQAVDSLSIAGNGWYFFLVNAGSNHTFVVAVRVFNRRSSRNYFVIQDISQDNLHQMMLDPVTGEMRQERPDEDTGTDKVSASELDEFLMRFHDTDTGATSRVWLVYNK
jgi:hypothetical protein